MADENMLNTVLRNLISNAIKYSEENGAVEVTAKKDGQFAEVTVSDTGIGMGKETAR